MVLIEKNRLGFYLGRLSSDTVRKSLVHVRLPSCSTRTINIFSTFKTALACSLSILLIAFLVVFLSCSLRALRAAKLSSSYNTLKTGDVVRLSRDRRGV